MILRISVLPGRDRRAKVNARRRGRGSAGFVWRNFIFGGGPRADAWVMGSLPCADAWAMGGNLTRADAWVVVGWGRRSGRRLRVRPRADAWAVGSGLLQLAESRVCLVVDALKARFVTGHQRQRARLIGERTDGHRKVN